jgi:ABC-type transporter Mla maintaining outer membrane lipid asymmetry permease subunit MlaE
MVTVYSPTSGFRSPLDSAKNAVQEFFEWFGELGFFLVRALRAALTPPFEFAELVHQFDELGAESLTLVALAGVATGIVLTLSTRVYIYPKTNQTGSIDQSSRPNSSQ